MSAKVPARSILKQSTKTAPAVTDEQKAKAEKDRRNLNIALQHAYRIQNQKDTEAAILINITTLMNLPASSSFTSKEAVTLINLVKLFQPSDYDSLIEERRIDGKCGYTLCGNPPRSESLGASAVWKLPKGAGDWCSNDCAKKALYIKAQLSETPAWERGPNQQPNIELPEDDRPSDTETAVRRANRSARINDWREKVANDEELALERGEKMTSFRPKQVMMELVVEKQPKPFNPANAEAVAGHYSSIEGYRPTRTLQEKKQAEESDSNDDDEDD